MFSAAGSLQEIGEDAFAYNTVAASQTSAVIPVAAEEVSPQAGNQFTAQTQIYHAVSTQAARVHEIFLSLLSDGCESCAATDVANAVAAG